MQRNDANLINVTIRIVHKDDITTLNYGKQDMFAYVLYFNQKFNQREGQILQKTTTDLIDLALGLDGTYLAAKNSSMRGYARRSCSFE